MSTTATRHREVEVKIRINGDDCFGIVSNESGSWRYHGDIEQCNDCGGDQFTVTDNGETRDTFERLTGLLFLRCEKCGSTYQMMED
jgi:hypothetical protein